MDYQKLERQGAAVFGLRQALAEFIIVFEYDALRDRVDDIFEFVATYVEEASK